MCLQLKQWEDELFPTNSRSSWEDKSTEGSYIASIAQKKTKVKEYKSTKNKEGKHLVLRISILILHHLNLKEVNSFVWKRPSKI